MITLNKEEWFDLNQLAFYVSVILAIIAVFYNLDWWLILIIELILAGSVIYFKLQVRSNKFLTLFINEEKWSASLDGNVQSMEIKDYWIQTGHLFIWLKGTKISVSFVLSRSIIGADKFSKIRAQIK